MARRCRRAAGRVGRLRRGRRRHHALRMRVRVLLLRHHRSRLGRLRGRTMTTHTRTFRVDDELWNAAKWVVAAEGRTVTDVLVAALRRLVAQWDEDWDMTPPRRVLRGASSRR